MNGHFRDLINLSLIVPRNSGNRANPENDSPSEINIKKFSTKFDDLGVVIMRKKMLYPAR